jgi:polyhydroxybutyrate depolymerase
MGERRWVLQLVLGAVCALALLVPLTGSGPAGAASPVAARPSAGCSLAHPVSPGTSDLLLSAGGDAGAFVSEIPTSYSGHTPMPVIVDLHGYAEPASLQVTISALGHYGESHGFITITPQVAYALPRWNTTLGGMDMAFIGGLFKTIDSTLCVDRNRLFVTGYSNGAFMTSSIACQYAGQVAAVATVAGLENPTGCHPARRIPVLNFHGTADPYVAYTGGPGPAGLKLPAPAGVTNVNQALGTGSVQVGGPSVPALTAIWARRDGCASTPHDTKVASDVTLISYSCPTNINVELYRITGGGHAWPGSVASKAIESAIGHVTYSISADQIMWKFFQAHPLRP